MHAEQEAARQVEVGAVSTSKDKVFNVDFWRRTMASLLVSLILLVIAQTIGVITAAVIWKSSFESKMLLLVTSDANQSKLLDQHAALLANLSTFATNDASQSKLLEQHAAVLANLSNFATDARVDRLEDKFSDLRSGLDRLHGRFDQLVVQLRPPEANK